MSTVLTGGQRGSGQQPRYSPEEQATREIWE
jgi:hypothetical protein